MKATDSKVTPQTYSLDWFLSLISADSIEVIFEALTVRTREWMQVSRAALWWLDTSHNGFRLVPEGQNDKKIDLTANFIPYDAATSLGLLSAEDTTELAETVEFNLPDFEFASSLAARIHYEERTTGILIVFPKQARYSWSAAERDLLSRIARNGAELCRNFEKREKLTRLVKLVQEMSEKTQLRDLYDLVLRDGRALLGCERAVVRGLNLQDGHLTFGGSHPPARDGFSLPHGEGITGLALEKGHAFRVDDVTTPEWAKSYRALWPLLTPTRSELAVPILQTKYRVRVKTTDDFVDKPFGVLNFESPTVAAFSSLDEYCAEVIADRMAPVMERIEYDFKLGKVRKASQDLATKRDWDSILDTLLAEIQNALGYEFVSLSIVDQDAGVIRCERVVGLPPTDAEKFRLAAVHGLDTNHVQADVVRHGWTDVPDPEDSRLSNISKQFGLAGMIRVFIPMKVTSRNEVIGTVSAGYDRTYRKHIYWRDIQLLRILVAFGTNAMELLDRGRIDRVGHEMNAPLTAVRANLQRLRRKREKLSEEQIDLALEDMETDANVLHFQMQQLSYVLGGKIADILGQPLNLEPVLMFKDIIIKTLSQLKSLVRDEGLDPRKVSYNEADIHKVKRIEVDKSKISQVIFNLFMNAVKYADNPESFEIRVGAEEERDHYVISFSDWGIGVPEGLKDRIFEERFRAPNVRKVAGSGLGLTIAREIMRKHGGDLILQKRYKPTEFHLIFPKRPRRRHENNVR
ncbi:MAG: GAF domain-containing sensor histidine kinase [Pyrinomonadaceae bacterium]|nr:GAF domain-containing sensor histidine kinase [Pyrinomonadaceae bacterium]